MYVFREVLPNARVYVFSLLLFCLPLPLPPPPELFLLSRALLQADVVLLLGARLNWILHFGLPPRFDPNVKIIQVLYAVNDHAFDVIGKLVLSLILKKKQKTMLYDAFNVFSYQL